MWHNQFFGHFVNISVVNYGEDIGIRLTDFKVFLRIQKLKLKKLRSSGEEGIRYIRSRPKLPVSV